MAFQEIFHETKKDLDVLSFEVKSLLGEWLPNVMYQYGLLWKINGNDRICPHPHSACYFRARLHSASISQKKKIAHLLQRSCTAHPPAVAFSSAAALHLRPIPGCFAVRTHHPMPRLHPPTHHGRGGMGGMCLRLWRPGEGCACAPINLARRQEGEACVWVYAGPLTSSWLTHVARVYFNFQVFQMFQRYVACIVYRCCKSRSGCCTCCNGYTRIFFFLEYARALRIISLRRSRVQQHSPETKKNKNKNRPQETTVKTQESRPYSPETSTPKFLAPALIHWSASARITSSRSVTDVVALRKQRAFLSFHTCQDTKAPMCCNGYTRMFQVYVSKVSSVPDVCCKYFIWMLHIHACY
jgi:hypothetical protein